jgi:hypothetical protein
VRPFAQIWIFGLKRNHLATLLCSQFKTKKYFSFLTKNIFYKFFGKEMKVKNCAKKVRDTLGESRPRAKRDLRK